MCTTDWTSAIYSGNAGEEGGRGERNRFPELAIALLVFALWFRTCDFMERRPNLHKERISGGDDLL